MVIRKTKFLEIFSTFDVSAYCFDHYKEMRIARKLNKAIRVFELNSSKKTLLETSMWLLKKKK